MNSRTAAKRAEPKMKTWQVVLVALAMLTIAISVLSYIGQVRAATNVTKPAEPEQNDLPETNKNKKRFEDK